MIKHRSFTATTDCIGHKCLKTRSVVRRSQSHELVKDGHIPEIAWEFPNSMRLSVRSRLKLADRVASALELSRSSTLQAIQACRQYCDNSKHGHSSTNLDRARKSRDVTSTSAAQARLIAAAAEPSALVRTVIFLFMQRWPKAGTFRNDPGIMQISGTGVSLPT
jgi:hypothetical protein